MESNFFKQIAGLNLTGSLNISINPSDGNIFLVSVLLGSDKVGDKAAKIIPPMILNGTAGELDEGFFSAIEMPLKQTTQLFSNMEQYLKQMEEAKRQSAMEKENTTRQDKQKTESEKKYDLAMKLVAKLETEGKHREAWMKVPDLAEYPEKDAEIRERKSQLSAKFPPSLF